MADLSHFYLNSDYTAPKETHSFSATLNSGATNVGSYNSNTKYIDITVPSGAFFENVTLTLSLTGETTPSPFMVYIKDLGNYEFYQITASLVKTNATTYRLYAYLQNMAGSTKTIPAFTLTAKAHLLVSAFDQ